MNTGTPLHTTDPAPTAPDDLNLDPAVVAAAAGEISRQESRCDDKADSLAQFSGALASIMAIVAAGAGAIAVLFTHLGPWALLPILLLAGAAGLWGSALLVLIYKVIRPDITPAAGSNTSFVHDDHLDRLDSVDLTRFHLDQVVRLRPLVVARFRALARSVDLIVLGFVALFAGAAAFGILFALAG
ncbi:hypothetical protein [Kutzneria buriramensis]|uniref:Pycsar effector protein domain-containing protein n=1 Tax=Kutzneria buriramensis TaxID=1045776 RepID=A0A3E0G6G3_9PSEU|nr:hypothetical protein [Kutzneria buriramensis]REH18080.1 hypothetical protein BCF44_13867 [Kutzneria buriramensis]